MLFRTLGICMPMIFLAFQANADTVIGYNLTALGAGEYQYNYSVFNDGSLGPNVPIQLFDIFLILLCMKPARLLLSLRSRLAQNGLKRFLLRWE